MAKILTSRSNERIGFHNANVSVIMIHINCFSVTFSTLIVTFNDETFIPMTRTELHTLDDFIATFGGLFSLFIGASILSIVELIYYSTIRIYFAYRNERRMRNKKDSVVLTFGSQNRARVMMDQQRNRPTRI